MNSKNRIQPGEPGEWLLRRIFREEGLLILRTMNGKTLEGALRREAKTLRPRLQEVILRRYGLKDGRCRTLKEVAQEYSLTPERIRQMEAKALRMLRHPSRSRKLKPFLVPGRMRSPERRRSWVGRMVHQAAKWVSDRT